MPISVRINADQMGRDDYENMVRELEERGSSDPDGRISHEASHGDGCVRINETWATREQFERHQEERFAVRQASGLDAGAIDIAELRAG